jgi:hypothetical protein
MSRGHPGGSQVYQAKLKKRNERAEERDFLEKAKLVFNQRHPELDPKMHRSKVTQLKKELMAGTESAK